MPSNHATGEWPKPYLLSLYNQAIDRGFIWVTPISAERAASLRGAFNRLRRRGDTSMAGIITPEMTLVSMGVYQHHPSDPEAGRVPIIYNKLPDGIDLPGIVDSHGLPIVADIASAVPDPATPTLEQIHANTEALISSPESLEINDQTLSDFVARMMKDADHG